MDCVKTCIGLLVLLLLLTACDRRERVVVPSDVMAPTIRAGQAVVLERGAYATHPPQRWDIVAFHPPPTPERMYVGRVVGLPGETIDFDEGGVLLIDGETVDVPAHLSHIQFRYVDTEERMSRTTAYQMVEHPYDVPPDHYYMLGDNVQGAYDSRYWGAVHGSDLIGEVTVP